MASICFLPAYRAGLASKPIMLMPLSVQVPASLRLVRFQRRREPALASTVTQRPSMYTSAHQWSGLDVFTLTEISPLAVTVPPQTDRAGMPRVRHMDTTRAE